MKKTIFLALLGLFTVFGYSGTASPVKQNFEDEFVLKPSTIVGTVVLQKTETLNFTKNIVMPFGNNDIVLEVDIENAICRDNFPISFVSMEIQSQNFVNSNFRKEKFIINSKNKNFIVFASAGKLNKYKDINFTENYKTVWTMYREYLKDNYWRINVKHVSYEELFEHTTFHT